MSVTFSMSPRSKSERATMTELKFANTNFRTLFSALGLDTITCGEIEPDVLIAAISKTDCKTDTEYSCRRFDDILKLATEAKCHKAKVVWE